MDYNRVQSYIKAHVLPKLDSLPDDVQSVKNAFDAWKADWTQARAVKLDNLDAKVSTRATAADMGTALERIDVLLGKGSVKQVQRGVVQWESSANMCGKEVTVNFAPVNPSKTIVLLQASHGDFDEKPFHVVQASLASLSETSMQLNVSVFTNASVGFSNNKILYASWQIIEFY